MQNLSVEEKKRLVNRMARIVGHANKVKTMIADDYDCNDILVQMAAVRAALTSLSKWILENHIKDCMSGLYEQETEEEQRKILEGLMDVMNQFVK